MRTARIKVKGQAAVYHCVTRVVGGAMLLDDRAKEVLRKQMWYMARFCGVEILSYCIMTNHFHVLVRVPERQSVDDHELLLRFAEVYGPVKGRVRALMTILEKGGQEAQAERERLMARMGDVSVFMKELKQRFSIWYNRSHKRYGTLWAERFKSVLIEDTAACLRTVAAYIDLNPVRAGLVEDPKDYRFCSYAEAVAGNVIAKKSLLTVLHENSVRRALAQYRKILFLMGTTTSREVQSRIRQQSVKKVLENNGELPAPELLRLRVRYFTDGMVLGSKEFVDQVFFANRHLFGRKRKTGARKLRGLLGEEFAVIRDLRRDVFS